MISMFQEEMNVRRVKVTVLSTVGGIFVAPSFGGGKHPAKGICSGKHKATDKRGVRLSEKYMGRHRT